MRRTWAIRILALCAVAGFTVSAASADNGPTVFSARMNGFNETTSILTNGTGTFTAVVRGNTLAYRLTFSGLTAAATQSHIHFAQRGVNGNVFVFLCQSATNPSPVATTPVCPAAGGTVTGTITSADVLGVPAQNITAGDFQGLLRILRAGRGYANVHTAAGPNNTSPGFPAGEIRGQIGFGFNGDD
jgi:hypothetical protein